MESSGGLGTRAEPGPRLFIPSADFSEAFPDTWSLAVLLEKHLSIFGLNPEPPSRGRGLPAPPS